MPESAPGVELDIARPIISGVRCLLKLYSVIGRGLPAVAAASATTAAAAAAATGRAHLREAVAAVNRPVLARLKRQCRLVTALVAGGCVHLALASVAAATVATARSACGTATGAALGVLIAFFAVKILVVGGENEFVLTFDARQVSVFKSHSMSSLRDLGYRPDHRAEPVTGADTGTLTIRGLTRGLLVLSMLTPACAIHKAAPGVIKVAAAAFADAPYSRA